MAEPLRVAYTIEQCWHRVPGGTATAAIDLAAALTERGDVDLVGVAARHRRPPDEAFAPPVSVRHLPLPRRVLYETWHRLGWPGVERATGPVDVVHGTGGATPPRGTAPLVVTVHDLAVIHHPDHFTTNGRLFLTAALDTARRRADLVICPSEATRSDCEQHGFAADRLVVVPHGVDAEPVTPSAVTAIRANNGLDGPFVLFVGTREPRKNLDGLVQAMALLDQPPPLVLVGPRGWGSDAERPEGLDIRMLDFVPRDDLWALYAAATVFCYPSLLEGFGLPVLEAMAQGTPVVTSAGTATEELVGDGGLTVDPRAPDAIAAALETVLAASDADARWGQAARSRAAAYTWARAAEQTVEAYRRVVAS